MPPPDALTPQQQLQYLDAMGMTLWVSRFQLPNALPTPACEWPEEQLEDDNTQRHPPVHRLQAMLRDAELDSVSGADKITTPIADDHDKRTMLTMAGEHGRSEHAANARALLAAEHENEVQIQQTVDTQPAGQAVSETSPAMKHDPLHFSFNSIVLGERWWVWSVDQPFDIQTLKLLDAVLASLSIEQRVPSHQLYFQWPIVEGFKVDDPLKEAADGVNAFISGRKAQGASPQWLVLFGDDNSPNVRILQQVLGIDDSGESLTDGSLLNSSLLGLSLIQAPSLQSILETADGKRRLWTTLAPLRKVLAGEQ